MTTAEYILKHPIFVEFVATLRADAERGAIPMSALFDIKAHEKMVGIVALASFHLPALPRPPQPRRISLMEWMDMQVMEGFSAQLASIGNKKIPYDAPGPSLMERAWKRMIERDHETIVAMYAPIPPPTPTKAEP